MKIGLLIIASEILDGKIIDQNTQNLAKFLRNHHLELGLTVTVNDLEADIHRGLKTLFDGHDLIITSGGLGPTKDDITKQTIASFLGRTISYDKQAEKIASENFQRYEKSFPGKDHGYSFLPHGFLPLNNSTGLAPGMFGEHLGTYIFSAPGVPKEFKTMLEDELIRLIYTKLDHDVFIDTVVVRTKKLPEEMLFGQVDPELWNNLARIGEVSSLPVLYGVDIGVKLRAKDQQELNSKKAEVLRVFDGSPVKPNVWYYGTESLEEIIVELANRKKLTYGFAESCTGGLCSHRVTGVSGSGNSFTGSVVCYDVSVKAHVLGVSKETLATYGAVSAETAREMSVGLAKNLRVDVAVSITGFAGPSGGTPENPVGTVFIGKTAQGETEAFKFKFYGDREQLKARFSQLALMTLLEELEKFA
ncbi:MAG TPA: nicotinamide-nucleotide amidohydrolase family protein [Bacteriovoracaceae bacterium]|nr:nicotinamide-nucleotide amidohydrolase family protein [Bacteriovoracaceae bacterium]